VNSHSVGHSEWWRNFRRFIRSV